MMIRRISVFLSTLLLLSVPSYANDEHIRGRLLSSYEGVGTFQTLDMGLELALDDQWYTYWRMPGDAGLAPVMDWSGSENVDSVKVLWPAPKRFTAFDLHSFGYDNTVVLPLKVIPQEKGKAVTLRLKLDVVVCHEICIPQTLVMEKSLPAGVPEKSADQKIFKEAVASLPAMENTKDLGIDTVVLGKDALTVIATARDGWDGFDLFVDTPDILLTAVPELAAQEGGNKAIIKVSAPDGVNLASKLLGKKAVIVLTNKGKAIEREFAF